MGNVYRPILCVALLLATWVLVRRALHCTVTRTNAKNTYEYMYAEVVYLFCICVILLFFLSSAKQIMFTTFTLHVVVTEEVQLKAAKNFRQRIVFACTSAYMFWEINKNRNGVNAFCCR